MTTQIHLNNNPRYDNVLFIGMTLIENFVKDQPQIKHFLNMSLKNVQIAKQNIETIINYIIKHNIKLVFFLYNCMFIQQLVDKVRKHNLPIVNQIKIIAWHQKHYFKPETVKELEKIIEYSKIQALKQPKANKHLHKKYVCWPYPAILPDDIEKQFDLLDEDRKKRYEGKYIICAGNNQRKYLEFIKICKTYRNVRFVIVSSRVKKLMKLLKNPNHIPRNLDVYTDANGVEFAYSLKNCYFAFIPYRTEGITPGHSTIAQLIYYGKPIVSSLNASMEESIMHGKTGYLLQRNDHEGYKKVIGNLINNEKLYKTLQDNTIKESHKRSKEYYLRLIDDMINEIIPESGIVTSIGNNKMNIKQKHKKAKNKDKNK